ncbi:hypothetical protein GJAV_G00165610 [Gymnothorax javanicus]|nr:hypothetical protein GJAV_G00165610 [Gymnothorax javanicus]
MYLTTEEKAQRMTLQGQQHCLPIPVPRRIHHPLSQLKKLRVWNHQCDLFSEECGHLLLLGNPLSGNGKRVQVYAAEQRKLVVELQTTRPEAGRVTAAVELWPGGHCWGFNGQKRGPLRLYIAKDRRHLLVLNMGAQPATRAGQNSARTSRAAEDVVKSPSWWRLSQTGQTAYNVFFSSKAISREHRVVKKILADGAQGLGVPLRSVVLPAEGQGWNPWEEEEHEEGLSVVERRRQQFHAYQERLAQERPRKRIVQIWSKAAIGLYLWEHILEGPLNPVDSKAQWREGEVETGGLTFRFYTGPALVQGRAPLVSDSLVLVLNGREEQKVSFSTLWLEHVAALVQTQILAHVAVVMLGNERCHNDWLRPYLRSQGGFIDLLFLVYDSPWASEPDVLQWPLGVATYRDFPLVSLSEELLSSRRPYLCNFLGTVYRNSSREKLMEILTEQGLEKECLISAREQWVPGETVESSARYRAALAQSDLTLCPVGMNPESYRVYEACAYGSLPVVEDRGTEGGCVGGARVEGVPFRLLKAFGAPFLFLRDWAELPALLERERRMTVEMKVERRRRLMEWYGNFRNSMKERFVQALQKRFYRSR